MPDAGKPAVAHEKYNRLIKAAQALPLIKVAVAHPCDEVSLESAVQASHLKLIEPILVGPVERVRRTRCGNITGASAMRMQAVAATDAMRAAASGDVRSAAASLFRRGVALSLGSLVEKLAMVLRLTKSRIH